MILVDWPQIGSLSNAFLHSLPGWAKWLFGSAGLAAVLAVARFLLPILVPRVFERSTKRTNIVRSLCYQIQCFEKQMIVAYYYPHVELGGYDALVAELQDTVLHNDGMSTLKSAEHIAVTRVLHECADARHYLSTQARQQKAYTSQYKDEIVGCAGRCLSVIYTARDRFRDRTPLRWPPSPRSPGGRRYWSNRGVIQRLQKSQLQSTED